MRAHLHGTYHNNVILNYKTTTVFYYQPYTGHHKSTFSSTHVIHILLTHIIYPKTIFSLYELYIHIELFNTEIVLASNIKRLLNPVHFF